jgi:hypothetical protein
MFYNVLKTSFFYAIDILGVPASYKQVKTGNTVNATVGFKRNGQGASPVDSEDPRSVTITVKNDIGKPEKFDTFTVDGIRYTVESVSTVRTSYEVIGYKVTAVGRL